MRTRILALTAATTAASLVMAGAGIAAASPRPAAPAASRAGTEFIQEVSASATSPTSPVIAYGVFTAAGTDTQTGPRSDHFAFPGGSFDVTFTVTSASNKEDPGTCASTLVLKISYKIKNGKGKFAGIAGWGKATNTQITLAAKTASGGCSATTAIAQQSLITAAGPVTLR